MNDNTEALRRERVRELNMADREEETGQPASMTDQLNIVRTVAQLLDEPDGEAKAKEALIEYWKKMEEEEKRHQN